MKDEPPAGEVLLDPRSPIDKTCGIVVEQRKVVHVADVRRLKHLGHEVIEAVQIQIGEELAGQIADRQAATPLEWREQSSPSK